MSIERAESLRVRMTSEEKALLQRVADAMGFSTMSQWLRWELYEAALALEFASEEREPVGDDVEGLDRDLLRQVLETSYWPVESAVRFGARGGTMSPATVKAFSEEMRRRLVRGVDAERLSETMERLRRLGGGEE